MSKKTPEEIFNDIYALCCMGISIIPITDGEKTPKMSLLPLVERVDNEGKMVKKLEWSPFKERVPSETEIMSWAKETSSFATVGGAVSGNLEILDFDTYHRPGVYEEWMNTLSPEATEWVRKIPIVRTARGGYHFRYRLNNKPTGSEKLYKDEDSVTGDKNVTIIETKGEGGYALIPPSVGYKVLQGSLLSIPVIPDDVHEEFFMAAKSFNKPEEATLWSQPQIDTPVKLQETRPGEEFASKTTWDTILTPHGWHRAFQRADGVTCWRRPGKNRGISATTGHTERDTLYVFSSNADPFDSEKSYNKFGAYALLNHKGDFKAAAKELADQGFGEKREKPKKNATSSLNGDVKPEGNKAFVSTKFPEDLVNAINVLAEGRTKGESSGFEELDMIMGGYIPGQSYLIYADTSVGKSVFALTTLMHLARRGVKSLYFDLENPMELTVERMAFIAEEGKLTLEQWRQLTGNKDKVAISEMLAPLSNLNIDVWDLNKLIDKYGDIEWKHVKEIIEEAARDGVRFIVIDHLHYFSPAETDHSYLGEIARQINNLCSVHGLSILVVAHTKKGLLIMDKNDQPKCLRPTIDHISGSAMISRHMKNIISIQRNTRAETSTGRGETTVYVDKTKYGPLGSFKMTFIEESLCFSQTEADRSIAAGLRAFDEELEERDKGVVAKKTSAPTPSLHLGPPEELDDMEQIVDDLVARGKW